MANHDVQFVYGVLSTEPVSFLVCEIFDFCFEDWPPERKIDLKRGCFIYKNILSNNQKK